MPFTRNDKIKERADFRANSENEHFKPIPVMINQNSELALNAQLNFILRQVLICRPMEYFVMFRIIFLKKFSKCNRAQIVRVFSQGIKFKNTLQNLH